jgi:hypothetical protein
MDSPRTKWTVLARIPDLNAAGAEGTVDDDSDGGLPTSAGRLVKQALSFRLLIGTALFLLAAAVIPFALGKKAPPGDPSPASDSATVWHSPSSSASANTSPISRLPTAGTAPQRPVALIPATSERSRPPAMIPPPDAKAASQPHRTPDGPLMSRWPNPAQAHSQPAGAEGPQASANQPITVRPSEYEADRRAGGQPQTPDNSSKK